MIFFQYLHLLKYMYYNILYMSMSLFNPYKACTKNVYNYHEWLAAFFSNFIQLKDKLTLTYQIINNRFNKLT